MKNDMKTDFLKKGIALVALMAVCSVMTARPHHHHHPAQKRVVTTVVVKKQPVVVKTKPVVVKKVVVVRPHKHLHRG